MTQQPTPSELIDGLKRSATIIQTLQQELQGYHEPIAIIGMGCRLPGDVNTPDAYWELLRDGVSAVSAAPQQLGQRAAENGGGPEQVAGQIAGESTYYGHYLRQVGWFDAYFFGISPREAQWMDPQQQLLLEVTIEALEHANLPTNRLANSRTGVYVGAMNQDYAALLQGEEVDVYAGTGTEVSFLAGRLSYILGLRGPSMVVGTACSSSLVTTHLACQALRAKECDVALSGGVSLILSPHSNTMLAKMQATAADGISKTFDAAANGYGRGEGCGILVLKRLSDAQRDGDTIWAVIRSSAVNHDGRSGGLTVPSGPAQEELLRQTVTAARINANQVSYIETHGTGTALGDPIEIQALGNVYCKERQTPLVLGAAKTNIGHLEPVSGVAGMMKVVLALQHKQIPPNLHFREPNAHIPWERYRLQIPTALTEWGATTPRFAGVSSFGLSGINAHLILEEAPAAPERTIAETRPYQLLTLSAKTPQALQELAQRYQDGLALATTDLRDFCYTAQVGRTHYPHRLSLIGATRADLQNGLATYRERPADSCVMQGTAGEQAPQLAFLFTGQGAQSVGMGRELYQTSPTFRAILDRCDALLREHLGGSLLAVLYPETGDRRQATGDAIDDTTYTQPALFVLEYALATLWQSWGIQPDILLGHSIGEVAAACVAGVFSLEDGLKLVAARGRLMGALPPDGAMVSVRAKLEQVQQAISPYRHEVAVGAINGPESIVLSGKREAVLAVAEQLAATGVATRRLTVSHAFHSPLMEPMLAAFRQVAEKITYHPPKIPLVSNLTGKVAGDEVATPAYWVRHVRETVRFAEGVVTLHEQGVGIFLEIGPKPVLLGMAGQVLDKLATRTTAPSGAQSMQPPIMAPSLRDGRADWQQMLESLGTLYVHGAPIDWQGFDRDEPRRKVVLPTYPFQRKRYWVETLGRRSGETTTTPTDLVKLLDQGDLSALLALVQGGTSFAPEERALLPKLLQALVEQQAAQRSGGVDEWLYETDWQPHDAQVTSPAEPGRWLIFSDAQGLGRQVADLLAQQGEQTVLVAPGASYQQLAEGHYQLNPAELADFIRLLQETAMAPTPGYRGIIHLWQMDYGSAALAQNAFAATTLAGVGSTLHLIQALTQLNLSPRLWLVTQGAQPVGPATPLQVSQAPLWGVGRVIRLEYPEFACVNLDLDPAQHDSQALFNELSVTDHEGQVAYRAGQRYTARLVRSKALSDRPLPQKAPAFTADGSYLITGGLGALGLHLAHSLVAQGVRHLVLTGRRGAHGQEEAVKALEQTGVQLLIVKADVAQQADVQRLLEQIAQTMPPLRGVFHAAGVLDDGILNVQTVERFTKVMAPKVQGAWHLHTLTSALPLDFFVCFSSMAALLGSEGQANYAAANAFMDSLCHHRRACGLPGLSINWGPWSEFGMATVMTGKNRERWATLGVTPIQPKQGVAILQQLLPQTRAQVGVLAIDWSQFFVGAVRRNEPFWAYFNETGDAPSPARLYEQLSAAPFNERKALLLAHLRSLVIEILRLDATITLQDHTSFFELGLDSLMAVEFKNRLAADLGRTLHTTLLFDYPTIDALGQHLMQEVLAALLGAPAADAAGTPTAPPQQAASLQDEVLNLIEQLEGDDLFSLFEETLQEIEREVRY